MGPDSAPDAVERGVVDSTKRLGRQMGVSASGRNPGIFRCSCAVQEVRVFAIVGESVVVRSPLVVGDSVRRDDGGMAALRECGELGASLSVRAGESGETCLTGSWKPTREIRW